MAKNTPATPATVEPASLIELSRKWAHDLITPEIRSAVLDTASLMTTAVGKIRKLGDLLHAQGVKPFHVHLTRAEKKTLGGDAISKYDALKLELDKIFDERLSAEERTKIATLKTAKYEESNVRTHWRQRLRDHLVTLEKVADLKDPNSLGEGEGEDLGESGTSAKTDHDRGVERLQSALKAFQKVEPNTVGYNVQQFCEGLEKMIAHVMANGKKPE